MPSDPERPNRLAAVMELFEAVVDMPREQREAYVREHARDEAMREEVLRLVAVDEAGAELPPPQPPDWVASDPEHVGEFRILRLLGQGGMGRVYEAEQADPRRLVALKVVRGIWLGPRMLARFRREVRVLASLRHPGIAQIYEAGTAEDGQPYFAMELVRGRGLRLYCQEEGLDLRRRLELVAHICDAVHHAHQKGFIHRDLKPSNIVIDESEGQGSGRPKILDFGVARATDADVGAVTKQTDAGEIVGTLAYMSPEQASGDPIGIDLCSDVYSIGVVAYELLSGRLPLDIRDASIHTAIQVLRESEPPRLGTLVPRARGDVETVVGKALAKAPEERYASAAEFAADIRRFLAHEPVLARRPTVFYQVRRFARRNRLLFGSFVTVLVLLVGGVVSLSLAVREIRAQRDEARVQEGISAEINRFLTDDILGAANPQNVVDKDIRVSEALNRAAEGIGTRFADQPRVEAAIRAAIGNSYFGLTEFEPAREQVERAVELLEAHDAGFAERRDGLLLLAMILFDLDRLDEADTRLDQVVQLAEATLSRTDPGWFEIYSAKAEIAYRRGDLAEARRSYEQILERCPPEPVTQILLDTKGSLALVLQRLGQLDESERLGREAFEGYAELFGPEHPYALTIRNNLALLALDQGRLEQAGTELEAVLETRVRTLGEGHLDTLVSRTMLGRCLAAQGRFEEALPLIEEAFQDMEASLGREHPYTRTAIQVMATALDRSGDAAGARDWRGLLD